MNAPTWLDSLTWSMPVAVEALRASRDLLPAASGVYVFTNYQGRLEANTGVLYVGMATSLRARVSKYLVDPNEMLLISAKSGSPRVNTSLKHAGKALLLVELQQKSRGGSWSGIWVRWTRTADPKSLERALITLFQPAYNTQGRSR